MMLAAHSLDIVSRYGIIHHLFIIRKETTPCSHHLMKSSLKSLTSLSTNDLSAMLIYFCGLMYFERWGLLLSRGDFYGVFNVLNVPTTCVLNTLLTTQQRGVHNVALSPQAEQRYTLETLKTILPSPTSDNYLRHRLKDNCLPFLLLKYSITT